MNATSIRSVGEKLKDRDQYDYIRIESLYPSHEIASDIRLIVSFELGSKYIYPIVVLHYFGNLSPSFISRTRLDHLRFLGGPRLGIGRPFDGFAGSGVDHWSCGSWEDGIEYSLPLIRHPSVRCSNPLRFYHDVAWMKGETRAHTDIEFILGRSLKVYDGMICYTGCNYVSKVRADSDAVNVFNEAFSACSTQLFFVHNLFHKECRREVFPTAEALRRKQERDEKERKLLEVEANKSAIRIRDEMLAQSRVSSLERQVEQLKSKLSTARKQNSRRFDKPVRLSTQVRMMAAASLITSK